MKREGRENTNQITVGRKRRDVCSGERVWISWKLFCSAISMLDLVEDG